MSMRNNRRRVARKRRDYRLMLRRAGRFCLVLMVTSVVVSAGVGLNGLFSVRHWHISGVNPTLAHAIERQLVGMEPMDFIHSRPAYLRARLSAVIPDLAAINISRRLPDILDIRATARVPVAFWRGGEGGIWLVDSKGDAYRKLRPGEHHDLPLLRVPDQTLGRAVAILRIVHDTAPGRYRHLSECIARFDTWQMDFNHGQSWLLRRGDEVVRDLHKVVDLLHSPRLKGGDWKVDARMETRWFIRKARQGGVV
ncbi:MAG TPA: hypothetical protein VJ961_03315 [Mariprofundaceae bacterium]|nr:hypothetical protein [Mariprofundaceae bacterium]